MVLRQPVEWLFALLGLLLPTVLFAEDPQSRELSVIFVGDVMLDNGPGNHVANGKDPFAKCAELLQDADLKVANLECVVGRGGKQVLKNYVFRAAHGSVPAVKKYFDAVSLANNHSCDFGPEGLTEAIKTLEREGPLPYFGAGQDENAARAPLILEKNGFKVALLGYNGFNSDNYAATKKRAGTAPLDEAKMIADIQAAKQKADFVIPYLHWGSEMMPAPDKSQRAIARKLVEAGATAVIGGHPHVTQTIEVHHGAPIIYSLGNFVFDYYPVDPLEWTGWVVKLKLRRGKPADFEIHVVTMDAAGIPSLVDTEE